MSSSFISTEDKAKIAELFETMNVSPGRDSDRLAKEWLKTHNNCFSGFVDNKWLPKSLSTLELTSFSSYLATVTLASEDTVKDANINSRLGLQSWISLSNERSNDLQKIAQSLEKNAELFAQVECLSSGKHLHKTRTKDVPNLIQSFYYHSNLANWSKQSESQKHFGVVCVVAEEFNNPLLSVSWRVASILAGGNVVLLLVDAKSCISAFLLAELCSLAGLPSGVLNVLPIDQDAIQSLPQADKVIFTGEHLRSVKYIGMAAKQGMPCEVLVSQRPAVIVYESADLHSAADGVLETMFFNDTRTKKSGCSVFVQASIQDKFHSLLEEKLAKISIGMNLSQTDMSCIVTNEQREQLQLYIQEAKKQQLKVVDGPDIKDVTYVHWKPNLICNMPTTNKLLKETVAGPIVITTPFRTVKESIAMFNHNNLGSEVSVWAEKLPLALEVAHKLRTRTIYMNSQNLFDASVAYGGLGLSGNSVEGGKERIFEMLYKEMLDEKTSSSESASEVSEEKRDEQLKTGISKTPEKVIESYGMEASTSGIILKSDPNVKFSYELHIGGSYKKPSGSTYRIVNNSKSEPYAYVGDGSSVDLQAAVLSAIAVQPKWQNLGKCKRLQILQKAGDALKAKANEFISLLHDLTGDDTDACSEEVAESILRLRFWSNHANYRDGQILETQMYGKVFQDRNPLGVIGIQSSNSRPLLSFLSTVIPAIAYGNAVVVVASEIYPIPSLKICEILQSSGLLGGTVNVLTGCRRNLTRHLSLNMNIDSVWFGVDGASFIFNSCSTRPKKVFDYRGACMKFDENAQLNFISESTYLKTIFIPMGDIFAN